jgi:hypothetical protein
MLLLGGERSFGSYEMILEILEGEVEGVCPAGWGAFVPLWAGHLSCYKIRFKDNIKHRQKKKFSHTHSHLPKTANLSSTLQELGPALMSQPSKLYVIIN